MKRVTKKNAIRAYKVFNPDWTCRGFQYEVGKSYHTKGDIRMCSSGFHACIEANDCFEYYDFDPKNKVAEVKLWGAVDGLKQNKQCASNIEIVKEISWNEVLNLVNTGKGNTGRSNSGNRNSGYRNSGNSNSGNRNSGNRNSGNSNSGNSNSGYSNSGDRNSGYRNSGNRNSGDSNSGYWNSGNSNSGNWNSCNCETGFFNSKRTDLIRVFNKPCALEIWKRANVPSCLYFEVVKWVEDDSPAGGYYEPRDYKEAAKESIEAHPEQWDDIRRLPNYDADVFEEIFGRRI